MEPLFTQLKKARESKQLSITDVAGATNINPDFLSALEEGRTDILPQTYVRAFLREYSAVVGLDPETVMRQYDEIRNLAPSRAPTKETQKPTAPHAPQPVRSKASSGEHRSTKHTTIAIIAIALALSAIVYWNLTQKSSPPRQDPQLPTPQQNTPASNNDGPPHPATSIKTDSLILSSKTLDTVWVRIVVDAQQPIEYIMKPNIQRQWKAKERFSISVGNAGAIEFTLNNISLGKLGKRGAVLRDSLITRNTLIRLQTKR